MPITSEDMRFVEHWSGRYAGRGNQLERDDMISDGMLSLTKAVELWDGDPQLRRRYQIRRNFLRKVVTRDIIDGIRSRNGRMHDSGEAHAKQQFRQSMIRLDAVASADFDETVGDRFHGVEDEHFTIVKELLAALPERERLIVWRTVIEGEPLSSVAASLGVTESRICQIRAAALARLRDGGPRAPRGEPVQTTPQAPQAAPMNGRLRLSDREVEVLTGIAEGENNRTLAERLFISEETIKSHIRHILAKLSAENRAHAVAIGFRVGLVA